MMRTAYDSGDNPARGRSVLQASLELLIRAGYQFRYGLKSRGKDGNQHTYTYVLRYGGHDLFLVAKSTQPDFHPKGYTVVASQLILLDQAAKLQAPILFSCWPDEDAKPHWRVFSDADELIRTGERNVRDGVVFINYEWDLGRDLSNLTQIWATIDRVTKRPEVKLEDYTVPKPEPGEHHCTECGATYYNRDTCPGCGHKEATA
jgi:hypothetical protein